MLRKQIISVAAMLLSSAWVCQVGADGNQTGAATAGGGTPVNNQVGGELYGNDKPSNPPLYGPQVLPLPSETRYAIERSGVLPSELLIDSQLAGPLPQYGAMSYIPFESPLQAAMKAPPPALWGPAYGPKQAAPSGPPGPVPSPQLSRDVQYPANLHSAQPPPPQYVAPHQIQPQPIPTGYQISPNPAAVPQEGTTIIRYLPTTKPATKPSE
jgi:hypothetical protein